MSCETYLDSHQCNRPFDQSIDHQETPLFLYDIFYSMEILNCLAQERGYKVEYNPQQHGIPLKQGATDDKYAVLFI